MLKFRKLFGESTCRMIGMIHINALPGTPSYKNGSYNRIIEKAKHEAEIYKNSDVVSFEML